MATVQYKGMRYVPVFGRKDEESVEWDNSKPYESLTIVTHNGTSYTSRQAVPAGIDISDEAYWALTGNYNAQVEIYRQETASMREELDEKPFVFDTVADMQESQYISVGMTCITRGFRTAGDGGGTKYIITDSGTADGMRVLECENSLYAVFEPLVDYVCPEMFGAIGDGVADDTNALQLAFDSEYDVLIDKRYLITSPLRIASSKKIFGNGTIKKTDTGVGTYDIDTIIILEASRIVIQDITLSGNDVGYGISFGRTCSNILLVNLNILRCNYAFYDYVSMYLVTFLRIKCRNCSNAFYFGNTIFKTTLVLIDCWAENCGNAYYFKNTVYSSLIGCGADWCNYARDDNPYGIGYGRKNGSFGVYTIETSDSIGIYNCGAENCYGNGVVNVRGGDVSIDGLKAVNIKSEYTPNYTYYPNWAVGYITTTTEETSISCKNSRLSGFENTAISNDKKVSIFAINYLESTYGTPSTYRVFAMNVRSVGSSIPMFDGMYIKHCRNLSELNAVNPLSNYIDINGTRIFKTLLLNHQNSTKLVIPFISYTSENHTHLLKIRALKYEYNNNIPAAFEVTIKCASLNTVSNASIIQASDENISVSTSGLNLLVTMPFTCNSLRVTMEATSSRLSLIDWSNASIE